MKGDAGAMLKEITEDNNPPVHSFISGFKWENTPLGNIALWPAALNATVSMCLYSTFPSLILWGNDLIQIYNEPYSKLIGRKHPGDMGSRAVDTWQASNWQQVSSLLVRVLKDGQPVVLEDHKFISVRNGFQEERYYTVSYSPIYTSESKPQGIYITVLDKTEKVLGRELLQHFRHQQLAELFVQAPIGLSILKGSQFKVSVANQKMLAIWGKLSEEAIGKPVFELLPELKDQGFEETLHHVLKTRERISLNETPVKLIVNGTEREIFVKVVIEPLLEEDGSMSSIMVVADDITEQLTTRKKIEESELRLKIAIEASAIGTFDWDIKAGTFQYSDRLAHVFGYTETRGLTQKHFADRIHPEDRLIRLKAHEEAFQTGTLHYEARVIWPDNSIRWLRIDGKLLYDTYEKPLRMYGTTLDITEHKLRSEELELLVSRRSQELVAQNEALKRSEQRYHRMVEEVKDYAIILLDRNGIIENWNQGAEQIKGYTEKEIIGKHFSIFYPDEERKKNLPEILLNEARENGRAINEGYRIRKDGTKFWGSITITALHDNNNEVIGFSKVTRDLTERKITEDKLHAYTAELEAQNRELEQFAYVASHDLQEPLRKIQTFADIIQRQINADESVIRYFEKINNSAKRMSDLIRAVLNYSKLAKQEESFSDIDLNVVMQHIKSDFELIIDEKQAMIVYENLPVVNGVALQISQLFTNLIANALKFNSDKPLIKIRSRIIEESEIIKRPDHLKKGAYHEISVTDNGIGFEQKYSDLIFSMFQRLHGKQQYAGTGIGLALCKKITENHGGYITVTSAPGHGSVFYVYLPV